MHSQRIGRSARYSPSAYAVTPGDETSIDFAFLTVDCARSHGAYDDYVCDQPMALVAFGSVKRCDDDVDRLPERP